jgi:hypothetical protein
MSSPDGQDKLEPLSGDKPLPTRCGVDTIWLTLQSLRRLHLYWDARDPISPPSDDYELVVLLLERETEQKKLFKTTPGQHHWLDVQPGYSYIACVGFYAADQPFKELFSSDVVRTGVSIRPSLSALCTVAPEEFLRLLRTYKAAQEELASLLEEADLLAADAEPPTRRIARIFRREAEEQFVFTMQTEFPSGDELLGRLPAEVFELRWLLINILLEPSYEQLRKKLRKRSDAATGIALRQLINLEAWLFRTYWDAPLIQGSWDGGEDFESLPLQLLKILRAQLCVPASAGTRPTPPSKTSIEEHDEVQVPAPAADVQLPAPQPDREPLAPSSDAFQRRLS